MDTSLIRLLSLLMLLIYSINSYGLSEKEPNNTFSTSDTLKTDSLYKAKFGVKNDKDWYYYKAKNNGVLVTKLTKVKYGVGVVDIYDSSISTSNPIYSAKDTAKVYLNVLIKKGHIYYIKLWHYNNIYDTLSYNVRVYLDTTDQSPEYNNDTTGAVLKNINSLFNAKIFGDDYYSELARQYNTLRCDEDWFKVRTTRDGVFQIKIDSLPRIIKSKKTNTNYVVHLFDSAISLTKPIGYKYMSGESQLLLATVVKKGRTLYIRLYESNNYQDSNLFYVNFHFDTTDEGPEFNDDFRTASPKPMNTHFKAKIWGFEYVNNTFYSTERDWYRIKPTRDGIFNVILDSLPKTYQGKPMNYYIEFYDSAKSTSSPRRTTNSSYGKQRITFDECLVKNKVYYIVIHSGSGYQDSNLFHVYFNFYTDTTQKMTYCQTKPQMPVTIGVDSIEYVNYVWNSKSLNSKNCRIKIIPDTKRTDTLKISSGSCTEIIYFVTDTFPKINPEFSMKKLNLSSVYFIPQINTYKKYLWNFGDRSTSDSLNPTHTYKYDSIFHISLLVTDTNGCSNSFKDTLNIKLTEIIEVNTAKEVIKIYPNPTQNGNINIQGIKQNSLLIVYDMMGRKVFSKTLLVYDNQIINTGLQKGLYYVEIFSINNSFNHLLKVE